MRRLLTAALVLAAFGLCSTATTRAQEKIAAPAASGHVAHTEACDAHCLHKVCIAVPDKKKISKTVYSCTEKDVCLPKCVHGGSERINRGHGCNDHCASNCPEQGCAACGRPRTVRVLMKKVVTEECPTTKCEVSYEAAAPACRPSRGHCDTSCPAPCTTSAPVVVPQGTPRVMPPAKTSEAPPQALPRTRPALSIEPVIR